jgi:hypothetical protein
MQQVKQVGRGLVIICCTVMVCGCASIISKSQWPVTIRSVPEQADVTITDVKENKQVHSGKTPATVTLSSYNGYFSGKTYKVEITKDDYETNTVEIHPVVNGWYFANLVFGGVLGMVIIDPLTGAMWTLSPKDIDVTLMRKPSAAEPHDQEIAVILLDEVPAHLRTKMIRVQ